MPRLRTILGFLAGLGIAAVMGLVPAELIAWLRQRSGADDPVAPPDLVPVGGGKRRRGPRRRH